MKKIYIILLVVSVIMSLSISIYADNSWQKFDRNPDPDTLTYSIIATEEIGLHVERYQALLDHVSKLTGKNIDWYISTSYSSVIEAMRMGTVDFANFGPTSAVMAIENAGAEVFAIRVDNSTGVQGYYSYITTRADSGIEKFPEDVKGKIIGFTDPASTSGHVAIAAYLNEIDVDSEEYFEEVIWTGSHQAGQLAVKEGRVDAACVASTVYWRLVDREEIDPEENIIIYQSELIPLGPATYRTDLDPELKEKIKEAYLTFHEIDNAKKWMEEMDSPGFKEAGNSDFDFIKKMQEVLE